MAKLQDQIPELTTRSFCFGVFTSHQLLLNDFVFLKFEYIATLQWGNIKSSMTTIVTDESLSDDRPVLKQLIANSTGEQQRSLRGKAFECALTGVEIKRWKWVAVVS